MRRKFGVGDLVGRTKFRRAPGQWLGQCLGRLGFRPGVFSRRFQTIRLGENRPGRGVKLAAECLAISCELFGPRQESFAVEHHLADLALRVVGVGLALAQSR